MTSEVISILKLAGFATVIALIEYVGVSPEMITLLAVLMAFDVATGIFKRFALGKKDITSRKLVVGVATKIFVLSLLLLLAWVFKITTLGNSMAISVVIGLFIAGEFYSSLQNVYTMKTKKEVTEYDAVTLIIGGLLSFVRVRIEKTLDFLNKQ